MKINWKVRIKNPYFWIGLVAVILAAVGITPESLTSWPVLCEKVKALFSSPFALGCAIVATIGYVNDPTTKGICDSKKAMTYEKPQ